MKLLRYCINDEGKQKSTVSSVFQLEITEIRELTLQSSSFLCAAKPFFLSSAIKYVCVRDVVFEQVQQQQIEQSNGTHRQNAHI